MITMRQIWIKKDQTLRRDEIISGDGVRAIDDDSFHGDCESAFALCNFYCKIWIMR